MADDTSHEHAVESMPAALRSSGKRLTRQRRAIWEAVVAEPDRHLSADDIAARVRGELPGTSPSTVYRTLDVLVDEGLLLRTDLGADRAFYEPAREHAHHHVVCERCGAVAHLHDEALGDLAARIEAASGFALGPGEITFAGLCADCQAATSL